MEGYCTIGVTDGQKQKASGLSLKLDEQRGLAVEGFTVKEVESKSIREFGAFETRAPRLGMSGDPEPYNSSTPSTSKKLRSQDQLHSAQQRASPAYLPRETFFGGGWRPGLVLVRLAAWGHGQHHRWGAPETLNRPSCQGGFSKAHKRSRDGFSNSSLRVQNTRRP